MERKEQLAQALPFWQKLSENEQQQLITAARREHFARASVVNRTGEECKGAILLQSGQLRVYMISEEGREVTLYRLRAGDICVLSASCLLDSIVFDVIIEAVEETDTLLLPSAVLHDVMAENPYVELFLQKTANERFSDVMWTMQQILFMGADRRVAIFLWDEMTKTGQPVISCTHDELARYIGSAREVVTRILKYFVQEGVVTLGRKRIEIVDKAKLKTYL